jgi:hypothetical protein
MTIKSEQQVAAEHLRRQKAASTDPDRLEREAQRIEKREGTEYLCKMPPGAGPWRLTSFQGSVIAASAEVGVFRLKISLVPTGFQYEWEEIKPCDPS